MKIEFNLQDLLMIFQYVVRDIYSMENPHLSHYEAMLQYNPEREKEKKQKHIESLKENKEYLHLLELKEKLSSIIISFKVEEE